MLFHWQGTVGHHSAAGGLEGLEILTPEVGI